VVRGKPNCVAAPYFDRLWTNIFRDLLPHAPASETTADFDRTNNELVVEYQLAHGIPEPAKIPAIYALGPNGFQAPLKVDRVAAGHHRGKLAIAGAGHPAQSRRTGAAQAGSFGSAAFADANGVGERGKRQIGHR
jgi:hypothetical protein